MSLFHFSLTPASIVPCVHPLDNDTGDARDSLSQFYGDDDLQPEDNILVTQLPDEFRLQERHPTVLDGTLSERHVSCGVIWHDFWERSAGQRHCKPIYDYRVVLAFDQGTINVTLPLDAYSVDEEHAAVRARALLEPIDGNNDLVEECGNGQARRASRAQTPNVRNIDQLG